MDEDLTLESLEAELEDFSKEELVHKKAWLNFNQFVNFLILISKKKNSEQVGNDKSLMMCLRLLMEQSTIVEKSQEFEDLKSMRQKIFTNPRVIFLMNSYWKKLINFYVSYAEFSVLLKPDSGYNQGLVLSQAKFIDICKLLISQQVLEMEPSDMLTIFCRSIRPKLIDDGLKNAPVMTFHEFVEALIWISPKINIAPLVSFFLTVSNCKDGGKARDANE